MREMWKMKLWSFDKRVRAWMVGRKFRYEHFFEKAQSIGRISGNRNIPRDGS